MERKKENLRAIAWTMKPTGKAETRANKEESKEVS